MTSKRQELVNLLEEYTEETKRKVSSIRGSLEYPITNNYSLYVQLKPIESVREIGYYSSVVIGYASGYRVEERVFSDNGEDLPTLNKRGDRELFERMLLQTGLPLNYRKELLDIIERSQDAIILCGTSLPSEEIEFLDDTLRNHENTIFPISTSIRWCISDSAETMGESSVTKGVSWDVYCKMTSK